MCWLCTLFYFCHHIKNSGCYDNGNSHILAKKYGSRDYSITIQASLAILNFVNRWHCGDYACHFFLPSHQKCGCYGNRNKVMPENTGPDLALYCF